MVSPNPFQTTDVRPAVNTNPEAVIFQFVTVRTPGVSNTGNPLQNVVTYRQNSSPFVTELISLRNADTSDVPTQLNDVKALTKSHIESPEFDAEKKALLSNSLPSIRLGRWLREQQAELTSTSVEEAKIKMGAKLTDEKGINTAWEALIADAILAGSSNEREDFMAALRAQYFLEHQIEAGNNTLALQHLAAAEIVLPANLFPLPQLLPPQAEQPASIGNAEATQAQAAKVQELNVYNHAISELRNMAAVQMEEARSATESVNLNSSGVSLYEPENDIKAQSMAEANRGMEFIGDPASLTPETQEIVARVGSIEKLRTSFIITQLEKRAAQLARIVGQSSSIDRPVFEAGGALWMQQLPAESAKSSSELSAIADTNIIGSDKYDNFYPTNKTDIIRPLGIADLNRVEQTIFCYKAGEVAHIENVMQGEYKERTTRLLRRSEETYDHTAENEQTREQNSETTERFELAQEASRVLSHDNSFTAGVSASGSLPIFGGVKVDASSNFSTSSSSTETDRQTSSYAKNITDRSLQRIVERVRVQRTTKLTEEYEENNKHGLDNRTGTKHVVGIYRWVDKIYQAQVVNYGKRLMFEFMLPQPGNFHLWAMSNASAQANGSIALPEDPRKVVLPGQTGKLSSSNEITTTNYAAWAAMYNADVEPPPDEFVNVGLSMGGDVKDGLSAGRSLELEITKGYEAVYVWGRANVEWAPSHEANDPGITIFVGDESFWTHNKGTGTVGRGALFKNPIEAVTGKLPVSFLIMGSRVYSFNIVVKCQRQTSTLESWKMKTFNAILEAYQIKKNEYDKAISEAREQLAAAQNGVNQLQGTSPTINQNIILNELKKGCINQLFNGQDFSIKGAVVHQDAENSPPVVEVNAAIQAKLEQATFIEQCFDWSLMSYTLYPYFWADNSERPRHSQWRLLYQLTDPDPLFLNFLKAGMARVHVPVRLGFEKAAMHFLSTGEIWTGGDRPGIGSPIYLSIMDELKQPKNTLVGQPWEIRVPTTMTILQAESGVITGKGLPEGNEPVKAL